jgi:hypothetical protein
VEILRAAQLRRRKLHERWEKGDFSFPFGEATLQKNAEALGELKALVWLLELDIDILKGELEDDDGESERFDPPRASGAAEDGGAG